MKHHSTAEHPFPARRRWMSVLARADAEQMQALLQAATATAILPAYSVLRGPEAGLVMVRGRAGGGGAPFNLGEMSVTRCTIRTAAGFIGHAYVTGRNDRTAELAALADAMMQDPSWTDIIDQQVIAILETQQLQRQTQRAAKAAATRVQFFAMQTMRT